MVGVYQILNKINGRAYIGQSVDIYRRWIEHKTPRASGNDRLHSDMRFYGLENFSFTIVEECEPERLLERERYYIREMNPYYNTVGKQLSQESRKKVSDGVKRWWENLPQDTKDKIITQNLTGPRKGHSVSEETREKLRLANIGKKQSKATIDKRIATMNAKKENGWKQDHSKNCKPVLCVETGETFISVKAAAEKFGTRPSGITAVLKGRQKTCRGYHFEYLEV